MPLECITAATGLGHLAPAPPTTGVDAFDLHLRGRSGSTAWIGSAWWDRVGGAGRLGGPRYGSIVMTV